MKSRAASVKVLSADSVQTRLSAVQAQKAASSPKAIQARRPSRRAGRIPASAPIRTTAQRMMPTSLQISAS